jgi:hypothetical protein
VIIDHFDKYPLLTQKQIDFELFKRIFCLVRDKQHITLEGFKEIVAIKSSLNKGLSEELKHVFPDVTALPRPMFQPTKIFNSHWISGFTSGDGGFLVSIFKSPTKIGEAVRLSFKITQHNRDEQLMRNLVEFFGVGRYFAEKDEEHGNLLITDIEGITNKVIPLFDKYPILGLKSQDFQDFKKVALLIKNKDHLTKED